MALRYLLDTDICIFLRSKRPPKVVKQFEGLEPGEAGISVITYGELSYGGHKSPDPDRALLGLERLTSLLVLLPLPSSAGEIYGEIRAKLAAIGQTIGGNDLWIAAHAIASGLTLVTNNEREFKRVKNLKIENWAK